MLDTDKTIRNFEETIASNVNSLSDALSKNTKLFFIFSALAALFLYVTLYDDDHSLLSLWFAGIELNSVIMALYCSIAKNRSHGKSILFISGLIINATLWGFLGSIVILQTPVNAHILIVMVSLAIAILGTPLCYFSRELVTLFSTLILLPLSIFFFSQQETVSIAIGIVTISLIPSSILAIKIGWGYKKRAEILEKKHRSLIDQLNRAVEEKESANIDLISEIDDKKKTATELIKARDTAEDAVKVKSEFLATMSHEIRTPMNGVIGMAELLLSTELTAKQRRFSETIYKSGKGLLSIINDILDFSKIEAGKLKLNDTVFDLRQLIDELGILFAEQAHRKGLEINYIYPVDGHTTFRGDDERIKQILVNLIGNAIKFTEQGEIIIRVDLKDIQSATLDGNTLIKLSIQDSGVGIDQHAQTRIFDSFAQADGSTTRRFGGTGLGLSICKKLSDLMGGNIGVESELGSGSTFWLSIPLKKETSLKPILAKIVDRRLKKLRPLIVDGNNTRRQVLEQEFKHWKVKSTATSNIQDALQMLDKAQENGERFHTVILDSNLVSSAETNKLLETRLAKHTPSLRVILMNNIGNTEQTGQWLVSGVDAYINKPVQQRDLYETLINTLFSDDNLPDLTEMSMSVSAAFTSLEKPTLQGHILVAEDNLVNQELVREMLTSIGCTVDIVDNGNAAFKAITDLPQGTPSPYELILMDCQMPVMGGLEATQKIREWEANQSSKPRIPVIALTANAMEGDREKCLHVGMDDYMSKPFSTEQLGAILHRWLPLYQQPKPKLVDVTSTLDLPDDEQVSENSTDTSIEIDPTALDKIRSLQRKGQPNVVIKVIQLFLDNSQKIVQSLEDAISNGNPKALARAASSLRSSCNTVGAIYLTEICLELETLGKAGNTGMAQVKLARFEEEYDRLREALKKQIVCENK